MCLNTCVFRSVCVCTCVCVSIPDSLSPEFPIRDHMRGNVELEQLSAWQRSMPTKRDRNLPSINTQTFNTAEDRMRAAYECVFMCVCVCVSASITIYVVSKYEANSWRPHPERFSQTLKCKINVNVGIAEHLTPINQSWSHFAPGSLYRHLQCLSQFMPPGWIWQEICLFAL